MRKSTSLCFWLLVLGFAACGPAAALADSAAIPYQLGEEASFEAGCLAPCTCPVSARGTLEGTLALVPAEFDGVFQNYRVDALDWQLMQGAVRTPVRGSGSYRVSGDRQQLTLDVSVDGAAPERYDSGLVAGGSSFPSLRLAVALHGFFCSDSVYGVQATPGVAGVGGPLASSGPLRLGPNPFHGQADIAFALGAAGSVDLRIHDLAGREIRALIPNATLEAGPHAVRWDGRRADGTQVPAGIYFVRLRSSGRETGTTLVKL